MGPDKKQDKEKGQQVIPCQVRQRQASGGVLSEEADRWRQEAFQEEGPEVSEGCLAGLPQVTHKQTGLGEPCGWRRSAGQTVAPPGSSYIYSWATAWFSEPSLSCLLDSLSL